MEKNETPLQDYLKSHGHEAKQDVSMVGRVAASFWARLGALFIDNTILFAGGFALSMLGVPPMISVSLASFFYSGYFLSKQGATPGKLVFKIEVVSFDTGKRLTFFHGGIRDSVGHFVSGCVLCLGYVVSLFNEDKRALHDFMFNTRVVDRR